MPKVPQEGVDFTVEKWKEYDNFCCMKCQFSTIFKPKIIEHALTGYLHKHRWAFPKDEPEAPATPGLPVY